MCMRWEHLRASGGRSSPAPAVKNHTATAVSSHELLVFGGYDGRRNHNALHLLDCTTRTWRDLTHEARGAAPAGRNGHTATLAERKLFVLGGWLGSGPLAAADLHILHLDTLTWEQPHTDAAPGPCNMHTADYVPRLRAILVFRGGDGREYLNDLHALHIDSMTWRRVRAAGQAPAPRANHSSALVAHGDALLVFGGWDGRQRLNDVHVLDTLSMAWSCVDTSGGAQRNSMLLYASPPLPRAGMTMAQHREKLYVFGGSGPSAKCYDDLHVYDPTHHRWLETVAVTSSATTQKRRHQRRRSSRRQRNSRRRVRPTQRRTQPRWDIYEDEEEDQEERSWSVEDHDENDEDEVDEDVDSDSASYSDDDSEGEAMIVAQGLEAYGLDDGANPNEMTEFAALAPATLPFDRTQRKREEPLLVVDHGPGRRAGHTCSVVGRLLVIFGGSCGADYLNDCFALDTDPPPRAAVSLPSPTKMLRHALVHYVDCEAFSDISFLVEGRVVFAHKLILSALSERFRVMFSSGFREARAAQIPVPDVRYEVFLLLLEYLYTGRVAVQTDTFSLTSGSAFTAKCQDFSSPDPLPACPQSADGLDDTVEIATQMQSQTLQEQEQGLQLGLELETMLELLLAADQFMLDHLKQRCEHALQHAVALPTVEAIAEAAKSANARQLQAVCCHFVRNHPLVPARRGLDGLDQGSDVEKDTASDEENDVDGGLDDEAKAKTGGPPRRSQAAIL